MRVNFNVLNQKGAPALYEDSLANRPPASFAGRLFVDTDQPTSTGIYRDTGNSWQQIAGGGGGGVNIYNSDGTLTGLRQLNGNNNSLYFNNIAGFGININDSGFIRKANFPFFSGVDFGSTGQYFVRLYYRDLNNSNDTDFYLFNSLIKTLYNSNDIGLKLDFANSIYQLGQLTGANTTYLTINDATQQIYTKNGPNFWGLYFDFLNNDYRIGKLTGNGSQMLLTPLVATINLGNGTTTQAQMGLTASQCNFGFIPSLGGELRFIGSAFSITGITSYTINGTGITQGTSGSVSGQHLKVTINGVNYVIELKNP